MESRYDSVWIATSGQTKYSMLKGTVEVDVVVIGGGIAGLTAAYFLAKEGKKVAVVEANRIVTGTSGFTTAKITSVHGRKLSFLKANFGLKNTKIYSESNEWAIDEYERIIKTEKISCEFSREDVFLYTNHEKNIEQLENEFQIAQEIGLPVELKKDVQGLPFSIRQAIKFPNQAQFHPRKFLLKLAEIIQKNGGVIFENSRVVKVSDGEPAEVETTEGIIRAKKVIVATNYPIFDKALLFLRMGQFRSYALAFKSKSNISTNMFVGVGEDEFTVRTYEEKGTQWIIIGGEAHRVGEQVDTRKCYQRLETLVKEKFNVTDFEYKWSAQDASPNDQVPYIGKMPFTKHIYVTTGYGEWGMTTSMVSAKLLSDLINKREYAWADLYSPSRINIQASLKNSLEMGKEVIKGFGSYLTKNDSSDFSTMKKGEGRVVNYKRQKVAVCRDEQGKLCALSAVCTHLDCIVDWNNAEMTWDCPCHGSRFTKDGEVIHGPAIQPLAKKVIST